jgi:hypothetical protein
LVASISRHCWDAAARFQNDHQHPTTGGLLTRADALADELMTTRS